MLISLVLNLLSVHSTFVVAQIVLESSGGAVYVPFTDVPDSTNLPNGTSSGTGRIHSSSSVLSDASISSHSAATTSAQQFPI